MHWADANKYLAEDRIMWLEIVAKEGCSYILNYVPEAKWITDPPLSLAELIRQRRRWFNGSLFSSLHVLRHVCRVWSRKCTSFPRNWLFLLLYFYLLIQITLSFVLLGSFYAVFSIFLRAILPSEICMSLTSAANIILNVYIMLLWLTLLLSTSIDIAWAENGFRFCSFAFGLFAVLMIVCSIMFALNANIQSISVILLGAFLFSYLIPLFINIKRLMFFAFIKGILYLTFLSATYINIFTIFSILNIHDVSWGSRQTSENSKMLYETERKKQVLYKDFRAKFFLFWIMVNTIVGYGVSQLYITKYNYVLFYLQK